MKHIPFLMFGAGLALSIAATPASASTVTLTSPAADAVVQLTGAPSSSGRYSVPLTYSATWDITPDAKASTGTNVAFRVSTVSLQDAYGALIAGPSGGSFALAPLTGPATYSTSGTPYLAAPGIYYVQARATECGASNPHYMQGSPDSCAVTSETHKLTVLAPPEPATSSTSSGGAPPASTGSGSSSSSDTDDTSSSDAGFKAPSTKQTKLLRKAWRAKASEYALGPVSEVHRFYVTSGAGMTNRFAVGCVDRPGYESVFGRVLRRVGSRWRAVSQWNIYNVDADGESGEADEVIPAAAYEGLQSAIRSCGRSLGIPYFFPGAEDQTDED